MYKDAQYKMAAQQEWSGVDGVSTSTFPWKKKLHGLVLKMQGREPIPVATTTYTTHNHNTRSTTAMNNQNLNHMYG